MRRFAAGVVALAAAAAACSRRLVADDRGTLRAQEVPAGPVDSPQPAPPPAPPALPEIPKLWDWNDLAATEARFRAAAAHGRAAGDAGYEAEAWTQVARTMSLRKRFDEAHAILSDTQPLLRADLLVPNVRWNLEKGRTLRSSGKPKEALPYFVAAHDLAVRAGHGGLTMDAMHMVALVEEPDAALDWALRAVAYAEASPDEGAKSWLAALYNNTGWTYFDRGEHGKAVALWEKAVRRREATGDAAGLRIAKYTVARGLRALGRHDDALAILQPLRAACDAAGAPDGYVHEELAENLLALGRKGEAKAQFARAYELLRDDEDVKADAARLERLRTAAGL